MKHGAGALTGDDVGPLVEIRRKMNDLMMNDFLFRKIEVATIYFSMVKTKSKCVKSSSSGFLKNFFAFEICQSNYPI